MSARPRQSCLWVAGARACSALPQVGMEVFLKLQREMQSCRSSSAPLFCPRAVRGCGSHLTPEQAAELFQREALIPASVSAQALPDTVTISTWVRVMRKEDGAIYLGQYPGWRNHPREIPLILPTIPRTAGTGDVPFVNIRDQIRVLNNAYSAGAGTYNSAPTRFRFRLCSVTRTTNDAWYNSDQTGTAVADAVKAALRQEGVHTLNWYSIGFTNQRGYLGYAYYPGKCVNACLLCAPIGKAPPRLRRLVYMPGWQHAVCVHDW